MHIIDAKMRPMRTAVNIDTFCSASQEMAARSGRSLGEVIDDALKVLMSTPRPAVIPR